MPVGSTNYPTSQDTLSTLVEARNNASTTLVSSIDQDSTALTGDNTNGQMSKFPASGGIIRVNEEIIAYSSITGGNQFIVQTRGFENTTIPALHQAGSVISLDITAASNNVKSNAIIAVEAKVGTGSSTPTANTALLSASNGTSAWSKITNDHIDSAAGIAFSKLATLSNGRIIVGDNGVPTSVPVSGDATLDKSGILTLSTVATPGTYRSVTVDSKGRVTSGTSPTTISGYGITDAYTKSETYSQTEINSFLEGLNPKKSVAVATIANIDLTQAVSSVDGISISNGTRVLVKDQTNSAQNGIYKANASNILSRDSDMNTWDEVPGAYVFVERGTQNADVGFVCTSDFGGILGTTDIIWVQFTGATSINTGAGLTKSGNTLSIDSSVVTLTGTQTLSNKSIPTTGLFFTSSGGGGLTLRAPSGVGGSSTLDLPGSSGTLAVTNSDFFTNPGINGVVFGYLATSSTNFNIASTERRVIFFTASSGVTATLPVASNLSDGWHTELHNKTGSFNITVNNSANQLVTTLGPGKSAVITIFNKTTPVWDVTFLGSDSDTGSGSLVFASSPTLTTPTFTSGANFAGSSGSIRLTAPSSSVSGTLTLPSTTDTVVVRNSTETLTNKTLAAVNAGTTGSCTVDGTNEVGFRGIPATSAITSNGTTNLDASHAGRTVYCTPSANGAIINIANATPVYPVGTAITIINDATAASVSITISLGETNSSLFLVGNGNTGSRTLARYGVATVIKVASNRWAISGVGLT